MILGLLYFCVVILCVNRSRSSFILYRIVKRHSRQSNVQRIWTCADNGYSCDFDKIRDELVIPIKSDHFVQITSITYAVEIVFLQRVLRHLTQPTI